MPKILVVDDSLTMRSVIRRELGTDRYEIIEAKNGQEALALIERGLVPDLVTLDVEMPGLNGFETYEAMFGPRFAARFARAPRGRIPVVFITACNNLEERRRGFELGAIDFISKNFEPGTLAQLVFRILRPNDRLRGINVLLVDDSPSVRAIVGKALSEEGVTVTEAEDGNRAFEILCNQMSETDLVITDIAMPGLDGHALCRRIRRELGLTDLPVVFFTGTDQEQRIRAFAAGATDCLQKPFIKEEMVARILVHLEKGQLHRRLRRAIGDLRTTLQSQSEMLATLSHDMRAPLNGILGFSDHLLADASPENQERENLEMIQQSGKLLLSLIEDVLALARHDSHHADIELQPLRLSEVIRKSVTNLHHLAKLKDQHLTLANRAPDAVVEGHTESLLRVLNNLLSNAIKFTPKKGEITVEVQAEGTDQVAIIVSDSGIGIPSDQLLILFERFTRTSRPGTAGEPGTGLGMSIVKQFVELHRGQISVTSKPGEGSRFRVTLPITQALPQPAPATPHDHVKPATTHKDQLRARMAGLRVLMAEDNPVNQAVTRTMLHNAGCTLQIAPNGQEAIEKLQSAGQPFDVLLMDMEMPELDGLAATRAIRTCGFTALPIIGLTGNDAETARASCMLAGMDDYLVKPFSFTSLCETILRHRPGGAS
ncbi:MAG TPA: response regulator [Opitutaceae bacterium]|mgnify:FL=1|nr:response regulator [Opitutaceae bacterium]HQL22528.1 response regulator [Opitutaceae bacterium]